MILTLECITTSSDRLSAHIITGIFTGSWQITGLWKHLFNDVIYSSLRGAEGKTKGCYGACCCQWVMPCKCGLLRNYIIMGICKIVDIHQLTNQCFWFTEHWWMRHLTSQFCIFREGLVCVVQCHWTVSCMFADLLPGKKTCHVSVGKVFYTHQLHVKHSSFISKWWHVLVAPNIHRLHDTEFTRMKLWSN